MVNDILHLRKSNWLYNNKSAIFRIGSVGLFFLTFDPSFTYFVETKLKEADRLLRFTNSTITKVNFLNEIVLFALITLHRDIPMIMNYKKPYKYSTFFSACLKIRGRSEKFGIFLCKII